MPMGPILWLLLAAPSPVLPPPASVYDLPADAFARQSRGDIAALRRFDQGLGRTVADLARHRDLFGKPETVPLTPDEKRLLLPAWASIVDYMTAIEVLRQRYWDFVTRPTADATKHVFGYLLTHAALTSQLAHGLAFVDLAQGRRQLEVLLDEPTADYGLPARRFAGLKEHVIHVKTTTQLLSGDAYRESVEPMLADLKLGADPDVRWLLDASARNARTARDRLAARGVSMYARNAGDILRDAAFRAFFPVQAKLAEWMGDTKVRRRGRTLIGAAVLAPLLARMQPGDVIVARQNWFLSNVGLPGFWPHAELYLGAPADLAAHFDRDPAVVDWVGKQPGGSKTLTGFLAARFPDKWKAYNGLDFRGDPVRVLESISEGVSFTGIPHGMQVDYVGVMRPRLDQVDKAQAIARAFGYQGRPYDFDFDFLSDAALVCTELVWKAYQPAAGCRGLKVPLVEVAGRMTLPANELVRRFDEEYDRPDRQLDFVGFLDGREAQGDAVPADVAAFRRSWRRAKWDVAQK